MKKKAIILVILLIGVGCSALNALAATGIGGTMAYNGVLVINVASGSSNTGGMLEWGTLDPAYNAAAVNSPSISSKAGVNNASNITYGLWPGKAFYGASNAANVADPQLNSIGPCNPNITVRNLIYGDLIVKVDLVTQNAGKEIITPFWMIYSGPSILGNLGELQMVANSTAAALTSVNLNGVGGNYTPGGAGNLSSLALAKGLSANTTTTLFNFPSSAFQLNGEVIISAFLVDNVASNQPQVIGFDSEKVYFAPNMTSLITGY